MFDIASANALRSSLPPFALHAPQPVPDCMSEYAKHYGLDFPDSELLGLAHRIGYFSSGEFKISCQYFAVPEASCAGTIFLMHGYYDHAGLYRHIIKYWLQRRFNVLIFDLPGHGLSSGALAAIDSFDCYQNALDECVRLAVEADLPKPWHMVGQSTGCSIIMEYCLRDCAASASLFDKVVLLAPLVRPYQWARGSLLHALLEPFVDGIARNFVENSNDQEFLAFVREHDPLQCRRLSSKWVRALKSWHKKFAAYQACDRRLLVLQGTSDTTVDWVYNLQAIKRKFPRVETRILNEARHQLVNERVDIRQSIFSILDQAISSEA